MKDLFAENIWKNVVCERFWELLFSENTLSKIHFAEKSLLSGKIF
jgi:hypothetical protein